MAVESPVSQRFTVTALLLLTFATGLVDAVGVLILGHVFVANMTGNVIFLGFRLVLISGLAVVFGTQNAAARQFGGTGEREKLRHGVILIVCSGAVLGLAATVVATSAAIFAFGPASNPT